MRSAGRIDPNANPLPRLNGLQRRKTFRKQRKQASAALPLANSCSCQA